MRDTLRALRLYVSPVFFRENPAVYMGVAYVLLCCGAVYHLYGRNFWHDGRFAMPDFLAPFWWLLLQACFTALTTHYWRQIRSPSTFMLWRMQAAEYRAVHVALPVMFALLALPVALLGAPVVNVMALESINVVVWSGADRVGPRDLRARTRVPRLILSLGAFMAMLVPSAQSRVLSAPWWVAAAILLVTVPMVLAEYRFRSYGMVGEVPVRTPRRRRARVPTRFSRAVAGVMMWQPPWLRRVPLPDGFASGAPLGLALQLVVLAAVIGTLGTVVACVTEQTLPSSALLHRSARSGVLQAVLLSALGLVGWMRSRRDWPFLLSLGPFGGRHDFARAMYRAHGLRSLQAAVLAGAFLGGALWVLGTASAGRGVADAACCAAVIVGASYLPSLAVLSRKLDRPGIVMLLSFAGILGAMQFYLTPLVEVKHLPVWMWATAPGALVFAGVMACLAPGALARKDWPIEPAAG